jgi:hypothetical protein
MLVQKCIDHYMSLPSVFGHEWFDVRGRSHRDWDRPARIERTGLHMVWYKHGLKHRDHKPAEISKLDGFYQENWYKDDKLHRIYGPAEIIKNNNGLYHEIWYKDGLLHREDGPAEIYKLNERYSQEKWYHHNKLHRITGPAIIITITDGVNSTKKESWFQNGIYKN